MKKTKSTKPRITTLTMDMGIPVQIKNISITTDGSLHLFDENQKPLRPEKSILERSYERTKGPKVLTQIPTSPTNSLTLSPDLALTKYDTIFAIDTNTRKLHGRMVSVAALVLGKWTRAPDLKLCFAPTQALEFHDCDCHPDLLALKHVIMQIENDPRRSTAGNIAFIIDSHLGNFEKIISRQIPILDECYFPKWANLIYASDAASDSISNILLRASDHAANSLLQQIESGAGHLVSQEESPAHASYFRVWNKN